MTGSSDRWPPHLIFNTDGNWVLRYLPNRRPDDITQPLENLAGSSVEALSVLIGIDDDLSWRGSPHGDMWGDHVECWDPDAGGIRRAMGDDFAPSRLKRLHTCLASVIEDGRDLMQIYVDGCRDHNICAFASLRMNDAHTSDEGRSWQVRSRLKRSRPDLLIGSPLPERTPGRAQEWKFSWQWDYAQEEVRGRFLGLIDETLERYDFDGVELDWMRGPPFFRPGQTFKNMDTLTDFMRRARAIVRRHARVKKKDIKLITRVAPSLDEAHELGLDTRAWIREGLADLVVLASTLYCTPAADVAEAVQCAEESGVLIYIGFDSKTHLASPHGGYELNPPSVLRAVALNGYKQGATGVHLFNYDYASHRAGPTDTDAYNADHLQLLHDLARPQALSERDRCYSLTDAHIGYASGDHRPQVPRRLPILGRGTGPGHAMRILIEDDVQDGLSDGRIKKTQLRVRLTEQEACLDRLVCRVNGQQAPLAGAPTIQSRAGYTWLVVDDPPVRCGDNHVLLALDGLKTPEPWPTVRQCEVMLLCE